MAGSANIWRLLGIAERNQASATFFDTDHILGAVEAAFFSLMGYDTCLLTRVYNDTSGGASLDLEIHELATVIGTRIS
jgi:hypothetical protein